MTIEEVKRMPFDLDVRKSELYRMGNEEGQEGKELKAQEILNRLIARRFGPVS